MVQQKLRVVLLVAHDRPEQRRGAAGGLGIDIGAVGHEQLYHLLMKDREHGQIERRIAVFHVPLIHAMNAQQHYGILMVIGVKHSVQFVGRIRCVIVLDIHIGAGIDERLRHGQLAVKRSHMQRCIAQLVLVGNQLGIALQQGLHFFDVATPGRIMNRAAEGEAAPCERKEHDGGGTKNTGREELLRECAQLHGSSELPIVYRILAGRNNVELR
jgi:hypothetical protein